MIQQLDNCKQNKQKKKRKEIPKKKISDKKSIVKNGKLFDVCHEYKRLETIFIFLLISDYYNLRRKHMSYFFTTFFNIETTRL